MRDKYLKSNSNSIINLWLIIVNFFIFLFNGVLFISNSFESLIKYVIFIFKDEMVFRVNFLCDSKEIRYKHALK